ncbi:hypothetical protein [Paenibacillus beijingensis]|uniref:DUF4352 domain-containing protein n=1 Tax=Paenibacillus beijingensis TaxID=1126833 RepID=A0A0D5NHB2_9BACL|nr:hypothetical protein [Paenibacillus beijingensis]AJY74525.1 hypothetical protein VN24_08015 [Paenibacillus beijingensis]
MGYKWFKLGAATIVASSFLLQGGILPAPHAAAAVSKISLSGQIVKLNASSYLNIRDAHFLMQGSGKVLAFSVAITNNGASQLDMIDYWLRVKTKSGKTFQTSVIEADKTKKTIAPKSTQYITYYAVVDNGTRINDLMFEVVKWDFSAANYERKLGTVSYPAGVSDKIAAYNGSVMLYNNNKLKGAVKQAFVTKDANSAYLTVNFLLENVGLQASDLSKMKLFIQTDSLSVYTVTAPSFDQTILQPKERKIVTAHAALPAAVAGKPLSFIVALNDEASKVMLPSGVFALPSTTPAPPVAAGQARTVYMTGSPVATEAGQAFVTQGSGSNQVSLDFSLTNTGTASIANPVLEYYLMTKSGISYPLTFTKEENATLLPNIEKPVSLTGNIPSSVQLESAQLVVKTAATDKEPSYIVANYMLQTSSQQGSVGGAFSYNDYSIKLDSVQRSPLGDSDMLVANLTITNNSNMTKQVPSLGGYFMVNGVKIGTEQKAAALDDSITIAPGASYNAVVYTSIPFTTSVDRITFVSTEPVQDKAGKQLYQFSAQQLSSIPVKPVDSPYIINGIGKRAAITIHRTAVFQGETFNNFYAEFDAVNNEVRASQIADLGGYIEDKNGIIIPVQFAKVKDKISPSGKALVSAWAKISKNFDTSAYQFIVGQSLPSSTGNPTGPAPNSDGGTGSGGSDPGKTDAAVVVNPVAYSISGAASATTQSSLTGIGFGGYMLDLKHIRAFLNTTGLYNVEGLKITADYTLAKDAQYESITGDHKLLIEFVNNDSSKTTYSKPFALSAPGTNEELLKEAQNTAITMTMNDPDIQSKINQYENYTLNVYDVYQDSKLLLASKSLKWFTTSE